MNADPVLERPGQIHSDDLVGCVHSVSINGRTLNLTSPLSSRGVKSTCPRSESGPCSRPGPRERVNSVCGLSSNRCYDKWNAPACQCGGVIAPNCRAAFEPVSLSEGGYIEYKVIF